MHNMIFCFDFRQNVFEIFGIKFWGTRIENAKREVFENTQFYVEGKRQELDKQRLEFMEAEAKNDKLTMKALQMTINQNFANFKDANKLEDHLLIDFLNRMRTQIIVIDN